MKLVWTKSKLPLSVIIRLVTGEDCSHFAFVFESAAKGLEFESNLLGTHPKFWANSQKSLTVVHEKDVSLSVELEDKLWDNVVQKYDDCPYDYLGFFYLGWRILLKRLFKIPMPLKNAWSQKGTYYCDEIYQAFSCIPGFPLILADGGMKTPHDLWLKLKDWNYTQ